MAAYTNTIDPTLAGDMTTDGRVVNKSEVQQQFTAAATDVDALGVEVEALRGVALTAGTGFDGTESFATHTVVTATALVYTQIVMDITDLIVSTTDADIIGESAAVANCNFGQITVALHGTMIAGKMTCLEAPGTASTDIDLWSADEATGAENAAVTALTNATALVTAGAAWTNGLVKGFTLLPGANQYLYLSNGAGSGNGTYTAGKFLIELWGTQ